jgi:hypothetical protein
MRFFIYLIFCLIFFSCNEKKHEFKSVKEMNNYLNDVDNGFISIEKTHDLIFEAKLVPSIYGDKHEQYTIHLRLSRENALSVLEIGNVNKQEIIAREAHLSFEILSDVYLEIQSQEIKPEFSHYERNYGLKPSIDLFFYFPKFEIKEDVFFNYRDKLFGQGLIKIKFKKELFTSFYVHE